MGQGAHTERGLALQKYATLAYVEDAKDTTHAAFKPGSNCLNCQFFIAANGACTLIPGFAVTAEGWCAVWAKKA